MDSSALCARGEGRWGSLCGREPLGDGPPSPSGLLQGDGCGLVGQGAGGDSEPEEVMLAAGSSLAASVWLSLPAFKHCSVRGTALADSVLFLTLLRNGVTGRQVLLSANAADPSRAS